MKELDKKCKGCSYIMLYYGKLRCSFTTSDVRVLPNCLCSRCLIKTICSEICEDFRKMVDEDPKIIIPLWVYIRDC
jgi:hypothetical protein